jgi:hypothetical protein
MTLEQEALNYANRFGTPLHEVKRAMAFVASANSKYVQAEKIKAQIELLYQARIAPITWFDQKMEELEQQLKQLEDETKI